MKENVATGLLPMSEKKRKKKVKVDVTGISEIVHKYCIIVSMYLKYPDSFFSLLPRWQKRLYYFGSIVFFVCLSVCLFINRYSKVINRLP